MSENDNEEPVGDDWAAAMAEQGETDSSSDAPKLIGAMRCRSRLRLRNRVGLIRLSFLIWKTIAKRQIIKRLA